MAVGLFGCSVYADVITVPCSEKPATFYVDKQCTAGEYLFKDISWSSTGTVMVPASEVLLHPVFTGKTVGMLFSSTQFNVGPEQNMTATLSYFVDPDPPIFDDLSLEFFAESPVGDSKVTLTMTFCAGARLDNCGAPGTLGQFGEFSLTWEGDEPNPGQTTFVFDRPVNVIDVIMTLEMDGGTVADGGNAQIDGARASSVVMPEPASFALTALGAAALLLARRHLRRR